MDMKHHESLCRNDNYRGRTADDDEDSDEQVPSRTTGFCVHNHAMRGGCEMFFFICTHGSWSKDCLSCRRHRRSYRRRQTSRTSHVSPKEETSDTINLKSSSSSVENDVSAATTPPEVLASRKLRFPRPSISLASMTQDEALLQSQRMSLVPVDQIDRVLALL